MKDKPKLAIVGRPNVGKSTLFNRICKKRLSIVDEAEGVTRDRICGTAEHGGLLFEVVDTGGIDPCSKDPLGRSIRHQSHQAIEEADSLVLVVDAHVGVTDLDLSLARLLLKTRKPIAVAVNKIDNMAQKYLIHSFHQLGIPHLFPVSALHDFSVEELLDTALAPFKECMAESPTVTEDTPLKIAIVGRPNVGKSTLVNHILNEERCLVSPIAGTTRDSIDVPFTIEGKNYIFIDTAGIRRKKSEKDVVEKFAAIRTERAIERADICVLLLDVQEGMTAQEKRIANEIEKKGKGCVLALNKWDLAKGFRMEHCLKALKEESSFLSHTPLICISAETGRNVEQLLPEIENVAAALHQRISTHQLNKFIERCLQLNHPPMIQGRRLRIYYLTQAESNPPKFILFVNHPSLMTESYKKYLINQLRAQFSFPGVPFELYLKGKPKQDAASPLVSKNSPNAPILEELSEDDVEDNDIEDEALFEDEFFDGYR